MIPRFFHAIVCLALIIADVNLFSLCLSTGNITRVNQINWYGHVFDIAIPG